MWSQASEEPPQPPPPEAVDRPQEGLKDNESEGDAEDREEDKRKVQPSVTGSRISFPRLRLVSNLEAEMALKQHISGKAYSCLAFEPKVEIFETLPQNEYRYMLETLTETRSTAWVEKPFRGQLEDEQQTTSPPNMWAIQVEGVVSLTHTARQRVPFTSTIKQCTQCHGKGDAGCQLCDAKRKVNCPKCSGTCITGDWELCLKCRASGKLECSLCDRLRRVKCTLCVGSGKLVSFLQLTVTWSQRKSEFVTDNYRSVDAKKLRKASGHAVYMEVEPHLLSPVNSFPEEKINEASRSLIEKHNRLPPNTRIAKQGQEVLLIPVTVVLCRVKRIKTTFYMVGWDQKVYLKHHSRSLCSVS